MDDTADPKDVVSKEMQIFWIIGFSFSMLGLFFQIFIYSVVACSRKFDQKILTQMTIARILNVVFEYIICNVTLTESTKNLRIPIFTFYMQTDAALICWMFLFTKNLYDKVIKVFSLNNVGFVIVSVTIWIVTFPIGLMGTLLLSIKDEYYDYYYQYYSYLKFFILVVNMLFFIRIFFVAISRQDKSNGVLRTIVVSFVILSITSLQVFLTDVTAIAADSETNVALIFCVFNSYQVIAITIIFTILVDGACQESLAKTIKKKLSKPTV